MTREVNRQWCLARRPVGRVKESDFEWREPPKPIPGPGQALVRNRYLSLGVTERCWMRAEDTFLPAQQIGEVVRALALGHVEQSNLPGLTPGDTVMGLFGWQDYALTDASGEFFRVVAHDTQVSAAQQLGLYGPAGVAAYFGLKEIARPLPGEVLVVSAAAGAVGSLAGQIGKLLGCRVIGITGSQDKCRWLTGELGFDAAIDYKREPLFKRLCQHCPDGVDVYFDCVGGAILEDVIGVLNLHARIVVCGMLSQYNDRGGTLALPPGPNNLLDLVFKRARMEGFVCIDYWARADEAIEALTRWQNEGAIKFSAEVVQGLRSAPRMMDRVFDGAGKGKMVLAL